MNARVKLDLLIDAMDLQMDESSTFFNRNTGDFVVIDGGIIGAVGENELADDYPRMATGASRSCKRCAGWRRQVYRRPNEIYDQ